MMQHNTGKMNSKKKKYKKESKVRCLTSDDMIKGFADVEQTDIYEVLSRHKKRLGVAECERVLIKWK
jgi:hypothetical protein